MEDNFSTDGKREEVWRGRAQSGFAPKQQLESVAVLSSASRCSFGQNALSRLQVRNIQQTMARQSHQKRTPDFHDKYGNAVLATGATFCISIWTYVSTIDQ
nr:cytochrome c oxidase subunit 7B, mitochondrial [Microcebus murinus]